MDRSSLEERLHKAQLKNRLLQLERENQAIDSWIIGLWLFLLSAVVLVMAVSR